MKDGEAVELSEGNIFSSVRASLAIQHGADIVLAMGFTLDYRKRQRSHS
jgi:hypothetical protein